MTDDARWSVRDGRSPEMTTTISDVDAPSAGAGTILRIRHRYIEEAEK